MTGRWPAKPPKGTPCDTRTYSVREFTLSPELSVDSRCPRPAVETLLPPTGINTPAWLCTECADERVAKYGYRRNPKASRRPVQADIPRGPLDNLRVIPE